MPDWPLGGDGQSIDAVGVVGASSRGTSIASHADAHTKGDWVEIVAATDYSAQGMLVSVQHISNHPILLDIGIGAGGSEKVLVPNLWLDFKLNIIAGVGWSINPYIPIAIPAGSRLSARVQDTGAIPNNTFVHLQLVAQGFLPSQPFSRCSDYGTDEASTGGTEIDPGATANTKGAWAELDASIDQDIRVLLLEIGSGGRAKQAGKCSWLIDIGIGAAASEKVVIPDLMVGSDNLIDNILPATIGPLPCHIPVGSRLAVRCQSTSSTAIERLIDVAVHGMD